MQEEVKALQWRIGEMQPNRSVTMPRQQSNQQSQGQRNGRWNNTHSRTPAPPPPASELPRASQLRDQIANYQRAMVTADSLMKPVLQDAIHKAQELLHVDKTPGQRVSQLNSAIADCERYHDARTKRRNAAMVDMVIDMVKAWDAATATYHSKMTLPPPHLRLPPVA